MFIKMKTPDNVNFAFNPERIRAIEEQTPSRSKLYFENGDVVAVGMGIDDAMDLLKGKPTTTRAKKTTTTDFL